MTVMLPRRSLVPLLIAVLGLVVPAPLKADACPFCSMQGQTLTGEVNQASMVLFGTLENAKQGANFDDGTTDLKIESIIKKHEILGDKKTLTLSRYIPVDKDNKYKFLIFCDVFKGKVDPYRGLPVAADSDMAKYLKGAMELKDVKDVGQRLRFFFDYLDNADVELSNDSYKEFGNADYKDYHEMAKKLPADKLAKWLQDPKTPAFRYGLYASMLGHCGKTEHAKLLRELLDDPQKRVGSGMDGVLAGYVMLQPKEGWEFTTGLLKDVKKEFLLRYAALRAARFLWEYRPDLIEKKDLVAGVSLLLDDAGMADLAIEDLRKWGRTELTERIVELYSKPGYDIPIVRRSIMRFALSNTSQAKAGSFVTEQRKKDPQMIADIEELLKLESATPAVVKPEVKGGAVIQK